MRRVSVQTKPALDYNSHLKTRAECRKAENLGSAISAPTTAVSDASRKETAYPKTPALP